MKGKIYLATILTALVAMFALVAAESDNSAEVDKDFFCPIFLEGHIWAPLAVTWDSQSVDVNNKNGIYKLTCKGQLLWFWEPPDKAYITEYESKWLGSCREVITPSGNVMLTCHKNPSTE
ncbi:MAG: hypothetical protein JW727_00465 [Candidatus Aenigmarchaeota archaeon]|nr:hypothetical protein [Candidatus Aenigmarchaeota archaeon]